MSVCTYNRGFGAPGASKFFGGTRSQVRYFQMVYFGYVQGYRVLALPPNNTL